MDKKHLDYSISFSELDEARNIKFKRKHKRALKKLYNEFDNIYERSKKRK